MEKKFLYGLGICLLVFSVKRPEISDTVQCGDVADDTRVNIGSLEFLSLRGLFPLRLLSLNLLDSINVKAIRCFFNTRVDISVLKVNQLESA